jgi:integrase/recombinase XerC
MAAEDLIKLFLVHLREQSRADRTLETYGYHLTQSDNGLPYGLDCATEDELRAWIWRDGYSEATRALVYAAHTQFFRWAVKKEYLDFDPTVEITRPKVAVGLPRVASDDVARLVLTDAKQPYQLWAQLAAYAGLRCIEIHRLHREHISERHIRVHGKGNKYRLIPTHPLIWAAVEQLPPGAVVEAPDEKAVSNRFRRYCEEHYGITFSLHRLRGWFATGIMSRQHDLRVVQELLGHSNPATTARYTAVSDLQMRAGVSMLPAFGAACPGCKPDSDGNPPGSCACLPE